MTPNKHIFGQRRSLWSFLYTVEQFKVILFVFYKVTFCLNSIFINNGHNSDIKNLHLLKSIDKQTIMATCLTPLSNRFNELSEFRSRSSSSCAFILKNNSIIRYFLKNFFCLRHSVCFRVLFMIDGRTAIC